MSACFCILAVATSSGVAMHATAANAGQGPFVSAPSLRSRDAAQGGQEDILVTGRKWSDADIGSLPIDGTVAEDEIIQLGSDTVGSLIDDLAPRTAGNGTSPILLINGRRVIDKSEILSIPAEAVERVEVLGERASLSYGARPGSRVLNIVLRSSFQSVTLNISETVPTEGGFDKTEAKATYASIAGPTRLTVNLSALRDAPLFEADRGLAPEPLPQGTQIPTSDLSFMRAAPRFRTLLPRKRSLKASAGYTVPLGGLTNLSLIASAEFGRNDRELGLASGTIFAPALPDGLVVRRYSGSLDPLEQRTQASKLKAGAELGGQEGRWTWNAGITLKRDMIETTADLAPDFAPFQLAVDMGADPLGPIPSGLLLPRARYVSHFITTSGDAHLDARGPLAQLSAGTAWVRLRGGLMVIGAKSEVGSVTPSRSDLSRESAWLGATIQLPLTKAASPAFGAGDVTLGAGFEVRTISDFGTLLDKSVSLTWQPIPRVSVHGSFSRNEKAPGLNQLWAPRTLVSGVRLVDFLRGEDVVATIMRQGNPGLRSQDDDTLRIGFVYQPYSGRRSLSLSVEFTDQMAHHPIAFLSATADMQLAFPDRFVRARDGSIAVFDSSPVNFVRAETQSVHVGIRWSWPLGPYRQSGSGHPYPRLYGYILDEWTLRDRLTLAQTVSVDYLAGDPKGYPGNSPHNRLKGKLGYVGTGFGGEVSATWQSSSVIRNFATGSTSTPQHLIFSGRLQIDLTAFVDFGRSGLFGADRRIWNGTRLRLGVDNLFGSRPHASTSSGVTPFLYHAKFLSPAGRTVWAGIRKTF
ncbi:TonB-dependent receptor [Novosphingobium sp. ZN18A2]|uniref:TonB-dependent receptor domain-containing protein n=1 Tax=Novosphingobium sp. ZN18A2 TaxID=3079861 RepID=UPI0030CA7637